MAAFKRAGEPHTWNPAPADISYIYRWGDGADHVSAHKGLTRDNDFGAGCPLIPDGDPVVWARRRLAAQFEILADGIERRAQDPESRAAPVDAIAVRHKLQCAIRPERAEAPT